MCYMNRRIFVLSVLFSVVLGFTACGDDDSDSPSTVTAAAATPTTNATRIKVVDDVVAAVAAKDAAKLTSLIHFWERSGLMVVGVGYGESAFYEAKSQGLTTFIAKFAADATKLYAVLEAPTFPTGNVPGKYQILYEPGMTLSVDDQGLTYLSFDGLAPDALIKSGRFGPDPKYIVKP